MATRVCFLAVVAALLASGCAGSSPPPTATGSPRATPNQGSDVGGTLQVGNRTRSYVLHLPPDSSRQRPTPIVLAFHGAGMSAAQMREVTHLATVADHHGFAALFPQGFKNTWNVPGFDSPARDAGVDDVAFVRALIDAAGSEYQLDTSRVVAAGFSNGAILVHFLGCSIPDKLLGIVPVAGTMMTKTFANCTPSRRISVLAIHGTNDPRIAYQGNSGDDGSLSFTETLAFWAKVAGCEGSPGVAQLADTAHDNTTVTTVQSKCASGTEVTGYSVNGGGHAWPGGDQIGSVDQAGVRTLQFDASELIWSFLDRHR